jgi:type IV secretory pathway VirB2 component (pilin)
MNPVTTAHIHLVLSHVPVMAILFGLGLLAFGVWRGSQDIQKAALGTFVAAALLAVPSYLTGEPASGTIKGLPGFSEHILEQHQAAAGVALAGCIALGIAALAGLIHFRGRAVAAWFVVLLLVGALVVGVLMARTANLGGQIRHSEIRDYDPQTE